ncbi:MAG: diguanylate cyclase [Dehalococcoidia bacterium]
MLARLLLLNNDVSSADLRARFDAARPVLRARRVASVAAAVAVLAAVAGWLPIALPVVALIALIALASEIQIWRFTTRNTIVALERVNEATAGLRVAREMADESRQQVEQLRVEYERATERQTKELTEQNRHLASMNAVSFVLSGPMDEVGATERALLLIARVLEVPAAELYLALDDGSAPEYLAVAVDPETAPPAIGEAEMARGAERKEPAAFDGPEGDRGTAGEQGARPGFAITPLLTKGRVIGSLAAVGERAEGWAEHSLQMLGLIGRELGVALENERLYRRAVAAGAREVVLSDLSRIISGGEFSRSLSQALELTLEATGGALAAVVLNSGRGRPAELVATAMATITEQLQEKLERSLITVASLVVDRTGPLILGPNGEAPLPSALREAGVGNLVLMPVMVSRLTTADDPGGDQDGERLPLIRSAQDGERLPVIRSAGAVLVFATDADERWDPKSVEMLSRLSTIIARRLETEAFVRLQERRVAELAGLAAIDEAIQSTIDPERLYSGFADAVHDLVPYVHMYIALMDRHGSLERLLKFGPAGQPLAAPSVEAGDSEHRWFALRGTSRWDGGDQTPAFIDSTDRHGLVTPMRPKGQLLGLVAITTAQSPRDHQAALLSQATEHLALALDSASLYRQATERAARLQVFGNLASTVASVVDLRDAFDDFADEMRWVVPFDRALMMLVDGETGEIEDYAACPQMPVDRRAARTLISATPLAKVVSAGEVMTLERSDPELAHLDWKLFGLDAQSVAAMPIMRNGETEAIFAIVRHVEDAFETEELLALEEVAGLIAVSIDRLRLYERAEFNARHDTLTGLPNRRFLDERLSNLRAGLTEDGQSALLMMDMDDFKIFNDTLGHEVGDRVLKIMARELRATCRSEDFIARGGGDEFVIVMEGAGEAAAVSLARRFNEALHDVHLEIPGAPSRISVSIGIAVAPEDGRSSDVLVRAADQAMYEAKAERRHRRIRITGNRGAEGAPASSIATRGNTAAIDALLDAARTGATELERDALLVAERLALGAAVRLEMHPNAVVALRLLVAGQASPRIADTRTKRIRQGASMMVDGFNEEWRLAAPQSYEVGKPIATAAIELAWLTAAAPLGSGLSIDQAAVMLREAAEHDAEAGPVNVIISIARAQDPTQRNSRAA